MSNPIQTAGEAQQPAMPVVSFVSGRSPESSGAGAAFRKALSETGFIEGQNVIVEYHWLDGQYDRLPALMAELVRRRVQYRCQTAHQQTRSNREQPVEAPHLAPYEDGR
jgi:hypothetical protein